MMVTVIRNQFIKKHYLTKKQFKMNYLKISLSVLALVLMGFSVNAQGCCGSKAKKGASCESSTSKVDNASSSIDEITGAAMTSSFNGQKASFKVYGNCGMCENRIEGALKNVKGIQSADWDVDTKMMAVQFDNEVISLDEIKKKIADVGHDTDKFQAKEEVYTNLPGCCQYDRAKA
ncbi:MAG: heavy-metal-associated domain-containing protein [Lewinellaceae bacterium]|nr:heavy-metal-associated domain-containing protein [Lewinellaceae bacterium]